MASPWRYIVDSGVNPEMSDSLKDQLRLANIIGLIVGTIVGGGFVFILWFYGKSFIFLPIIGALTATPAFIYNRLGFVNISRWIIAILRCLLISIFSAYMAGLERGEYLIGGFVAISVGFTSLPLVIFSIKEKWPQIITLILNSLAVLLVPYYAPTLECLLISIGRPFLIVGCRI